MSERGECKCPMRDGAHEYPCGHVGEYEYVHCKACDKAVWMASMAMSLCSKCQRMAPNPVFASLYGPSELAGLKEDLGSLPQEPCCYCHRQGGVYFVVDDSPWGKSQPQQCGCKLCGMTWIANSTATGG